MLIDQLPALTDPIDSDELPIERGTTSYKVTKANLLKANLKASDIVTTAGQNTYGTLAANAESGDYTIPISNPGYTPIAVTSIDVYGTGSKSVNVFRAGINSAKTGVYCRFANLSDSATGELRLSPRIIWIKS